MEPFTDLTQAQSVSQSFSLSQPLDAQMQMCKGRSGQRIEGEAAQAAPEPRQVTVAAMLDGLRAGAVQALRPCRRISLDDVDRGCTRIHRRQFVGNSMALLTRQLAQSANQPCQISRPDLASPGPAPLRPTTSFRLHWIAR